MFLKRSFCTFRYWLLSLMGHRAKHRRIEIASSSEKTETLRFVPCGTPFIQMREIHESRAQAEQAWKQEIQEGGTVVPIRPVQRHYPKSVRRFIQES